MDIFERIDAFEEIVRYREYLENNHAFFGAHNGHFSVHGIETDIDHNMLHISWNTFSMCCGIDVEETYILVDAFEHGDFEETFRRGYNYPYELVRLRDGLKVPQKDFMMLSDGIKLQKEYRERNRGR